MVERHAYGLATLKSQTTPKRVYMRIMHQITSDRQREARAKVLVREQDIGWARSAIDANKIEYKEVENMGGARENPDESVSPLK